MSALEAAATLPPYELAFYQAGYIAGYNGDDMLADAPASWYVGYREGELDHFYDILVVM